MPSYLFAYSTPAGPQSARFTLDEDGALDVQVGQVIEELWQRGNAIQGAPDDELAIFWNGAEVDSRQTPRALGIVTSRPIELRMRPRPVVSHQFFAEAYFPRAAYAAVVAGMMGGVLAWLVGLLIIDLPPFMPGYAALDVAMAALLGACIGAAVLGADAFRRLRRPLPSVLLGAVIGAVSTTLASAAGAGLYASIGAEQNFAMALGFRVLTWSLVGLALGVSVAIPRLSRRPFDIAIAGALGLCAGLLGAFLYNVPGPTALWQGLGFAVLGAAVGYGVVGLPLGQARALVEVEASDRRGVGLFGARGLVLTDEVQTALPVLTRGRVTSGAGAMAWFDGRRVVVKAPDEANGGTLIRVGGEPLDGAVLLGDGEAIDVGTTRYRLHVVAERVA